MKSRNLTDKVIVITGASSGIGAATALACAKAGMDVALAARREDKLKEVARQIESAGRRALVLPCDVTKPEDLKNLFEQTQQHFRRVDVIFANAGFGLVGPVLDTPDKQHRDIFETNYFASLETLRAGVDYLRKTEPGLRQILICSSAASEIGLPYAGAYGATKAAQDAIAGALRGELARERIKVTSIHPVGTRTDFFDTAAKLSHQAQGESNTPAAFMQSADHVAHAILKAIRKPRPEVWPMPLARLGLALLTAMPTVSAHIMQRHARKMRRSND